MSADPKSEVERFEALWVENHAVVFRFVLRRLGDPDAAEDVTSDAFLTAWRRRKSVPRKARPWLLGVARKTVANHLRGERRRETLIARIAALDGRPESHLDDSHGDDHDEFMTLGVAEAFNALSSTDREVLSLIAWEGLKPREAAKVLGMDAARFSVRLHRAKNRLRKNIEARVDLHASAASDRAANSEMRMEIT